MYPTYETDRINASTAYGHPHGKLRYNKHWLWQATPQNCGTTVLLGTLVTTVNILTLVCYVLLGTLVLLIFDYYSLVI